MGNRAACCRETKPPPRRLSVVNQVVGPLNRELLEDLCRAGIPCEVLTGWVDADDTDRLPYPVTWAAPLVKSPAWRRVWSWTTFTARASWFALRRPGGRFLVVTNPPLTMLAMPCLKRLAGLRYVLLVYDIYPDVGERMGMMRRGGLLARTWRRLSRRALLRAEGVITLGSHMADTLRGHLRAGDSCPIEVIPSWADTEFLRPLDKAANPFVARHGLAGKFVVMYSGNFGATHDTESIVAAAERLRDLPDVHIMLIGGGTREREVADLVAAKALPNLTLLPFQPLSALPHSLASADAAIVCLDEGYEGIAVPSKTYHALAVGAALLAISPPGTELTDLVAEHACGIHVPPRSPERLAEAVRSLHGDRDLLARCRANARRAAEDHFSRTIATRRCRDYLCRHLGIEIPPACVES